MISLQGKRVYEKEKMQRLQSNRNIMVPWPQTQLYVHVPAKLPNLILH